MKRYDFVNTANLWKSVMLLSFFQKQKDNSTPWIGQLRPQEESGACFNKESTCCVLTETGTTPSCLLMSDGFQVSGAQTEACRNAQAGIITPFINPQDNKILSPETSICDLRPWQISSSQTGHRGAEPGPRQFRLSSNYFMEFLKDRACTLDTRWRVILLSLFLIHHKPVKFYANTASS